LKLRLIDFTSCLLLNPVPYWDWTSISSHLLTNHFHNDLFQAIIVFNETKPLQSIDQHEPPVIIARAFQRRVNGKNQNIMIKSSLEFQEYRVKY
jgi:hypothetical protein